MCIVLMISVMLTYDSGSPCIVYIIASRPGVRLLTERLVKFLCRTRFAESGLILTARPHTGREYYYGEHSTE